MKKAKFFCEENVQFELWQVFIPKTIFVDRVVDHAVDSF